MNGFSGGAHVAGVEQCLRARDWSGSPLGPPSAWPPALAYAARFMFDSATPMFLAWGDALGMLYNDAAVPVLRGRHPARLGAGLHAWTEAWAELAPHVARALAAGFDRHFVKPVMAADILAVLDGEIARRTGTSTGD